MPVVRRLRARKKNRQTGLICMATNVGSLGAATSINNEVSREGVIVRQQLHDTLAIASNKYGKIDILMLQECNRTDVKLPPFFPDVPSSSNDRTTYGRDDGGVRGVCNYTADSDSQAVDLDDTKNEICVSICYRKNCKGQKVGIGFINAYRNQSREYERTTDETVRAILKIKQNLRNVHNIDQVFVQGDFNDERTSIPGLWKKEHKRMFHKKDSTSRKTYIDLAFTNIQNCGYLEVYDSCENVHNGSRNKSIFGHKTGLFWIGCKPKPPEKRRVKVISMKRLKEEADKFSETLQGIGKLNKDTWEEHIEKKALEITEVMKSMIKKAEISKIAGKAKNDFVLMQAVEEDTDTNAKSKTPNKPLYRLAARAKAGCSDLPENAKKPELQDFKDKLEKKLKCLNVADRGLMDAQIEELFPINREGKGSWVKQLAKFKRLILTTSNLAAKDYMGMSLQFTKIVFGHNQALVSRFQEIAELCFVHGYFPWVWRQDQISFLYKNKGSYSDASNWRPITISPSLGKHLERVMVHFISSMDVKNDDNNAYSKGRSCLSAIVDVQGKLVQAMNPYEYNKNGSGDKEVVIISTDDIAAAFESVDHYAVAKCIGRAFAGDNYKIAELVRSYLHRRSDIIDRATNQLKKLQKRYEDKTAPQGSLLSPFLWLIFDAIFTHLYKKTMRKVVESENNRIVGFYHTSYADDHLSILKIRVPRNYSEKQVCAEIARSLKISRNLIVQSTTLLGCGVNPSKSENIVPKAYHEAFKQHFPRFAVKCTFKWLGYFLTLTNFGEMKFDRPSIEKKLKSVRALRDSIFQYTSNRKLRLKIYKIYLAPYVELYLPLVVQTSNKNSEVHRFQHDCLCRSIEICHKASRIAVEKTLKMLSVDDKVVRMAHRLTKNRRTFQIMNDAKNSAVNSGETITSPKKTRSGKVIEGSGMARVHNNFVYKLNRWSESKEVIPVYNSAINMKDVYTWVKKVNNSIAARIKRTTATSVLSRARARIRRAR